MVQIKLNKEEKERAMKLAKKCEMTVPEYLKGIIKDVLELEYFNAMDE